jgi:hypothetical protein
MMKKLLGIAAITLTLASCASPGPAAVKNVYGAPLDCEVEAILDLDPGYQAFDQTDSSVPGRRVCAIGIPNSDVGVFFGYQEGKADQWAQAKVTLKATGYKAFDIGNDDAEVLRKSEGDSENGVACSISGFADHVMFTITEPGFECDDTWDKQLAVAVLGHAKK